MNRITAVLLIMPLNLFAKDSNIITHEHEPKPMIEGNRRVDEVMEWNKNHPGVMPPLTEEEKYEIFTKNGYPLPGTGAQVINRDSIHYTPKQKQFLSNFVKAQKSNGYYERYNKQAIKLLKMPESAEKQFESNKTKTLSAHDTQLREALPDLAMNYSYHEVPRQLTKKVIGYAPEHTFSGSGWNGAVEFFVADFDGICAYHEVNIEITQSSAYIPKDIASHIVNNKITTLSVSGNKDSGFVYDIEWWDKKFKRQLECATKSYSQEIKNQTIELAKKIDKN